jgi:protease I
MAKVLMIIAQKGFRDEELLVPKEVLERAGHSAVVTPDMAVYEVNPDFFDCIVVVGGPGSPVLADNDGVTGLVRTASDRGKLVGAICLGPMALAKAGVLAGRNATIYPDGKAVALLRETAARYKAEPVVTDGNIVTADGPQSAGKFGAELAAMLEKKK